MKRGTEKVFFLNKKFMYIRKKKGIVFSNVMTVLHVTHFENKVLKIIKLHDWSKCKI